MKKALALLLALVMIVGMMPLGAFAAETVPTITMTPSATDLKVGDTFTVSVDLSGNTGIASFQLQLLWNADVVSMEDIDYTNTIFANPVVNPAKGAFTWAATTNVTEDGNIMVATFKVLNPGECGIHQNAEYYYSTDEKNVEVWPEVDETAIANLTASCAHVWADATCTAPKTCTLCGATEGEAAAHSYESVVTAPTCTEAGYTTNTCSVCGDVTTTDEVAALGHTWDAGVVTAPTETEQGYTTYTCTVCGATEDRDFVDALGHTHNYEAVVTAPTCTEGGYTTYTCSCGDTYTADETEATGHNHEAVVTAPTCTEAGYTTYTCSACGDTYTADEVEATGHTILAGECTVCGVKVQTVVYAWYGDGTGAEYTISTAEELAQLAAIVNGTDANYAQDDFSGKTVSLANDIALAANGLYVDCGEKTFGSSGYPLKAHQYVLAEEAPVWTPIGTGTATATYNNVTVSSAFAGTFDGKGHTVSGVYTGSKDATTVNTATVQGLFGVVTGTVKNLTVSGCVTGRSVIGGVVAYLNGGTIENCVNNAIVFSDGGNKQGTETGGTGAGATGGIVGRAGGVASVTDCVNNAEIICANSNKGGRVAGIIGVIDATGDVVTVERNANRGVITGYQYVAGIVGLNYSNQSPITLCLNSGDIHAWGAQKIHVGGIVGQFNSPVDNCYNRGNINLYWTAKTQYVGGIAGDRTTYSGTAGNALTVTNCYNTGYIYYATKDTIGSIGIIAGDVSANSANNYYLDEGFAASSTQCGAVSTSYATSMTSDELKAAVASLNGEAGTAWKADGTCTAINDGYPLLAWQEGAVDHAYESVVTEPTCTEAGYTTYTCSACGDTYVADEVEALGHAWKDATCTEPATCERCGETSGDPNGHSYEAVVTEPTCTEGGYTTYTCSACGDSYVDDYTDALYHDYRELLVEPTCTEQGYTIRKCVDCGHTYNYQYTDALGHTDGEAVIENQVAATCTEDAYHDEVVYCTVCEAEVSRETVTEVGTALGHTWLGGTCSVCGVANPDAEKYAWYEAGTETASYTISTADELKQLAAIVNGTDANYPQDNFAEKVITLANDIALAADGLYIVNENVSYGTSSWPMTATQFVLKEEAPVWTPIGAGTASGNNISNTANAFAGTFDGQGHKISGVYTGTKNASAANTETVQGLFGVVSGTVKNLTVSGCITGKTMVAGVAAYLYNGGAVENCVNEAAVLGDAGNVPGSGKEEGASRAGAVGGIVARASGTASVVGCVNNGHVVCANSNKGGRVAGIIGLIDAVSDEITISKNVNNGRIEGYQYVAGIVGMNYSTKSPVDSCINTGAISGACTNKTHVGGIVGQYSSVISNCYNTGDITVPTGANAYAGHIGGDYGAANPTIINCYTTGNFYGNNGGRHYGIMTGCGKSENCYYLDTAAVATTSEEQGTVTAKTAEELKAAEMVALLNGESGTAWKMDGNCIAINNGYPILTWQTGEADHEMSEVTCTEPATCGVCGATEGEALGHDYVEVVTEPTCTEKGYTSYVCTRCEDSYVDEESYVDATGHCYKEWDVAPTCTEQGYTHRECIDCGDTYDFDYVEALGHSYSVTETVDATCTEDGKTVYTCDNCGDSYEEVIPAIGHSYEDGTCTDCGAEDPDYEAPSTGSSWWEDLLNKWFGKGDNEETQPEPDVTEPEETEPEETEPEEETKPGWNWGWFWPFW